MVRERETPAEPSLHRQVGSAREYPARQEPRPPENTKLLVISKHALSQRAKKRNVAEVARLYEFSKSHDFGYAAHVENDSPP